MVRLLNGIEYGQQLVNDWSFAIAVEERDPVEYAREWVTANPDVVKGWLGQ